MRVTSAFFVAALVRRANGAGASAVVARRGAADAGAIFVSVDWLDGTADFYAPAPQSAFDDAPTDRLFTRVREHVPEAEVAAIVVREMRFDPDLWVVAIEDRAGRAFVETTKE